MSPALAPASPVRFIRGFLPPANKKSSERSRVQSHNLVARRVTQITERPPHGVRGRSALGGCRPLGRRRPVRWRERVDRLRPCHEPEAPPLRRRIRGTEAEVSESARPRVRRTAAADRFRRHKGRARRTRSLAGWVRVSNRTTMPRTHRGRLGRSIGTWRVGAARHASLPLTRAQPSRAKRTRSLVATRSAPRSPQGGIGVSRCMNRRLPGGSGTVSGSRCGGGIGSLDRSPTRRPDRRTGSVGTARRWKRRQAGPTVARRRSRPLPREPGLQHEQFVRVAEDRRDRDEGSDRVPSRSPHSWRASPDAHVRSREATKPRGLSCPPVAEASSASPSWRRQSATRCARPVGERQGPQDCVTFSRQRTRSGFSAAQRAVHSWFTECPASGRINPSRKGSSPPSEPSTTPISSEIVRVRENDDRDAAPLVRRSTGGPAASAADRPAPR